jgi:hypothetical protein
LSDGRKRLEWLAILKSGFGLIKDNPVADLQPFQLGIFAMSGLGKAAFDAAQHMVFRNSIDPKLRGIGTCFSFCHDYFSVQTANSLPARSAK